MVMGMRVVIAMIVLMSRTKVAKPYREQGNVDET
jgi:hypothetical protein